MLQELDIRDFAIVEHVHAVFGPGLTAITGETGAGKSITIDALDFLLGGKPDSTVIRAGAPAARVEGIFDVSGARDHESLSRALEDAGVTAADGVLIIAREIGGEGRTRTSARVNGRAVLHSALSAIGACLVDIHGQTDHGALLEASVHVDYLDRFAGTLPLRAAYVQPLLQLRRVRQEIARLQTDERERVRLQERLRFEVAEIATARLQPGEEEELRAELQLLANAEQLSSLADSAHQALQGGRTAAVDALGRVVNALQLLADVDPRMAEDAATAAVLQEQAADLARTLRSYKDSVEFNPRRLAAVEERLALLNQLQRKYGATVEEVIAYAERATTDLADLDGRREKVGELLAEQTALLGEVGERATALASAREEGAVRLVQALLPQLRDLRLGGSRFAVQFARRPESGGAPVGLTRLVVVGDRQTEMVVETLAEAAFDHTGVDRVEFLVSLNPGEPVRPLARVASGGEISRLMLALKTVLGEADAVPTLVFDEIEAGLGGRSAGVVGDKLAALARRHQVICITHQPQIAALADAHLVAAKAVADGRTSAALVGIGGEAREQELATMLGGVSALNLASARALLGRSAVKATAPTKAGG